MNSLVRPAATAGYRPAVWADGLNYAIDGRPRFTWLEADRMRYDPQVQFALRILRAPLYGATWKVAARDPRVARFVDDTLKALWQAALPKVCRFFEYGVACGEVVYRRDGGRDVFDELRDVHPRDARPLRYTAGPYAGHVAGVRVASVPGSRAVHLGPGHYLWFSGEAEFGSPYGRPRMAGMHPPWLEKTGRNGATDSRRHFYRKVSYRGGMMRYPPGMTDFGSPETGSLLKSNQDVAREIVEKFEAGGVLALPSTRTEDGKDYAWTWEDASSLADAAGVREYPKDLDREILVGAGVPPELVEAASVGSGYSGRAIPAQMFFTSCDEIVQLLIACFVKQVCEPLVAHNFGREPFRVRPDSLAKLVAREPGEAGQGGGDDGDDQGDDGGGRGPGGKGPLELGFDRLERRFRRLERKVRRTVHLSADPPAAPRGKPKLADLIHYAMLHLAEQADGADVTDELRVLAGLARDPDAARELVGNVQLGWEAYQGPRGGKGWKNTDTGRVIYGGARPGEKREKVQASAKRARELALKVVHGEATPELLEELADHLPALPVERLRATRVLIGGRFHNARRRDEMAAALVAHARQRAAELRDGPDKPADEKPADEKPAAPAGGGDAPATATPPLTRHPQSGKPVMPAANSPAVAAVPDADVEAVVGAIDADPQAMTHFADIADRLKWDKPRLAHAVQAARVRGLILATTQEGYNGITPREKEHTFLESPHDAEEHVAMAKLTAAGRTALSSKPAAPAPKPVAEVPPRQPPADPDSPEFERGVTDIFNERAAAAGPVGVPIHDIRQAVAEKYGPEYAHPARFNELMLRLRREKKLRLVSIDDRSRATSEQLRDSIHAVGETFFYALPGPNAKKG